MVSNGMSHQSQVCDTYTLVIPEITPQKGTVPGRDPLQKFTLDSKDTSPFPRSLECTLYLIDPFGKVTLPGRPPGEIFRFYGLLTFPIDPLGNVTYVGF